MALEEGYLMSRSPSFYVLFPVCSTSSVWKQRMFSVFHVFLGHAYTRECLALIFIRVYRT
jgi:hypothetical protein